MCPRHRLSARGNCRIGSATHASDAVHDGLHIFFGVWALLAALRFKSAVAFNRSVVWVYGALIILGLIPITNTLFGIAPIYGNDIWLHLAILLLAVWGGYARGSKEVLPRPSLSA